MSITLLTSVPGGGKTSYAVWNVIKKAHEEGKIIYTVGIPKLKIPTIELSYEDVRNWNQTTEKPDGLNELSNIEHGSILVIDEPRAIAREGAKGAVIRRYGYSRQWKLKPLTFTVSCFILHDRKVQITLLAYFQSFENFLLLLLLPERYNIGAKA